MTPPGEGASLTTGEAAARRAALEEAAQVAEAPVRALTYGGCRTAYEQTAASIRALMDRAPEPDAGLVRGLTVAAEEAQIERDAARARIAELTDERDGLAKMLRALQDNPRVTFTSGAEAMREAAAARVLLAWGENRIDTLSMQGLVDAIRALPLPEPGA